MPAEEKKAKKREKRTAGSLPDRPVVREELSTPEMHDLSHQRDERCVPIAFELVKLMASMKQFPVGSHVNEKIGKVDFYLPVTRALMKTLIEKEVKITEVTYIFSLVRQALEVISDAVDETLNQNMNRITEVTYGLNINKSGDITVNDLNKVVMRRGKFAELWKSVLDEDVKLDDTDGSQAKA